MTQTRYIIDQALATAMHTMQITIATALVSTPGDLAFSRDMFLNTPLLQIGKQAQHGANSMSMTTYAVPIRSNISMTMLWVRKF
eukprot:7546508-Ditylum_brightwellii.AAC.1